MHTPEPWTLSENFNWRTHPFSVVVRRPGVHATAVANIPTRMTIPPEQQRANARLIAAAPSLLSALQLMLQLCHDVERDDETVAAVAAARSAISRATTGEA